MSVTTYTSSVVSIGMLDIAILVDLRSSVMRNVALMAGSSKHGKAFLASVASNWVAAIYLKE